MINKELYKKILLEERYISEEDHESALAYEKAGQGDYLDHLLQKGLVNRTTLGFAVAEFYKTTFSNLEARTPSLEVLGKIPEEMAREYRMVLVKEEKEEVVVASDKPDMDGLEQKVASLFANKKVKVTFAMPEAIDTLLSYYQQELDTRFAEIIAQDKRVAPELFDEIIADALRYRASDIHFEPQEGTTMVRFRIDGMLQLAGKIPKNNYENVLNRIKIQANLRTDEHFSPQDGAIRYASKNNDLIDLRVSIAPTLDGEKIVVRVLTEYVRGLTFQDLGFSGAHIQEIEKAGKKPFGMIIVSGPTGSGKTTTLYSLINNINSPEINITTIEDPVEYRMLGTSQMQVNKKTEMTFAKGLRAIVRQDPDIILVGEIRDGETAETAINAALTGHLLLSTFHANDAATTIPRLMEMGVESFLLASTLELVIAQRLVRKLCESCRESYQEDIDALLEEHPYLQDNFGGSTATLYRSKGCTACNHTGYKGRTSIIELLSVDTALKNLIGTKHPSAEEVRKVVRANNPEYRDMFADGVDKVKIGITTLEEVLRVANPPLPSE